VKLVRITPREVKGTVMPCRKRRDATSGTPTNPAIGSLKGSSTKAKQAEKGITTTKLVARIIALTFSDWLEETICVIIGGNPNVTKRENSETVRIVRDTDPRPISPRRCEIRRVVIN
jgi:hypothetical protein